MNLKELRYLIGELPDEMEVVMHVEAGQVIAEISTEYSGVQDGVFYLSEK